MFVVPFRSDEEESDNEKVMTLDEYKALSSKSRYNEPLNLRQAGENEDQSRWGNTRRLQKPVADTDTATGQGNVSPLLCFSLETALFGDFFSSRSCQVLLVELVVIKQK